MPNQTQKKLFDLQSLKHGDRKVFKLIFNHYHTPLFDFVQSLTKNRFHTEDIVQETFIVLWNKREGIDINLPIKNYLFKTAYNKFIDQYRKDQRKKLLQQEWYYIKMVEISEESIAIREQKKERLRSVINELPPKCKQIFELSKYEGLKYKEISDKLDISIKTVENQMSIALSKLRVELKYIKNPPNK